MRLPVAAALALLAAPAFASPDCSHAGPKPSAECAAKLDYCKYTSIVFIVSYRSRLGGKPEEQTSAAVSKPSAKGDWYDRNGDVVKDVVHQLYKDDAAFQALKAKVGPTVLGAAQAINDITKGCIADPKIVVDSK